MSPTILVVGATGNTGRGVVETLSELLKTNTTLSGHKILALTRCSGGATAQRLAKLPSVEVEEQNWVEITPDWLRQHQVVRAFIASHNQPNQFAEESTFHLAALNGGVQYVVRISTTAANVRPDCAAYLFSTDTLRLMASEDAPVGIIDPYEVGIFAAHLLTQDDVAPHDKAKYILNGPEDITGRQVVAMVEQYIGTKVEDVRFQDLSFVDHLATQTEESKNVIMSIKHAADTAWEGKCTASTTSKQVLQLAAPKNAPAKVFKTMLEE
ncbi:hypothetical protein NM208_g5336 [Fusarium decemcellulare]|uniref:Uncharacterized protein n=1 Tax=Fusarium decemcellulare TaxID=57161 RepID=A0ACC1SHH2_9HYPO|nr:hypothetical protein NM208_g5336 [Fusarium decemcellulare]